MAAPEGPISPSLLELALDRVPEKRSRLRRMDRDQFFLLAVANGYIVVTTPCLVPSTYYFCTLQYTDLDFAIAHVNPKRTC